MAERRYEDEMAFPPDAFGHGQATAFGSSRFRRPGVLETLTESFGPVPRVLLRDTDADSPIVRPASDEIPARLDAASRYQLFGEIARGGMGAVIKGRDPDLGRELAIKVLLERHCDDPEMVSRFVEEAQIAGQLQHPGIVPIYELGAFTDRRPYFAMRLVKGRTLASLLSDRTSSRREIPQLMAIFESVAQTVAYAHSRGVIHRDLKPSNVMVGAFGEVQVMDWGLAKVLSQGGAADDAAAGRADVEPIVATARSASDSDLSLAGSVMGTPSYMAPEQARGEVDALDERSDVFALGSVLAEILTGKPAFTGRNSDEIHRKAARGDLASAFARLDAQRSDPELIALAKDCLRPERDDRPRDAGEIARSIGAYRTGVEDRLRAAEIARASETARAEAAQARANAERRARRSTAALAASILVLVVLGGVVVFRVARQRQVAASRLAEMLADAQALLARARSRPDDPAKWQALVEAVKRAEDVNRDGWVGSEDRERLLALKSEADACLRMASQDQALLQELVEIRANRQDAGPAATHAAYDAAFREAGLDFNTLVPAEAARSLELRPVSVRAEIAAFLDDWYRIEVASDGQHGLTDAQSRLIRNDAETVERSGADKLRELARLADPDGFRDQLRSLTKRGSIKEFVGKLREVARDPRAESLPAPTAVLLASYFEAAGETAPAAEILRKAVARHPEDLWANYNLAVNLQNSSPPRREEAVRYYTAARSIRPTSAHVLAHLLSDLGRTDEAKALFLDLAGRQPEEAVHQVCLAIDLGAKGRKGDAQAIADRLIPVLRSSVLRSPQWMSYMYLSYMLRSKGDVEGAIAALREGAKLAPRTKHLMHGSIGDVLFSSAKDPEEAIAEFRESIRLKPDLVEIHFDLGLVLNSLGRYEEALVEFGEAVRIRPGDVASRVVLGHTLNALGRSDEAMAAYREAIRLDPSRAAIHIQLGNDLAERGKFDEAVSAFREATRLAPDDADAHNYLGKYLSEAKGDFAAAAAEFRAAIGLNPDDGYAHFKLGVALNKSGSPVEALAEFREAVRLKPDSSEAHNNLGVALRAKGDLDGAVAEYRRAILLKPDSADAHNNLGNALKAKEELDGAAAEHREAIRLKPDFAEAHNNLGNVLHSLGDHGDAIAEFRLAARLKPDYAEAHYNLGNALHFKGDLEGAVAAFRLAIRLKPDYDDAHVNLGVALQGQGDLDGAAAEHREAIRLKPDFGDAHSNLGNVLLAKGDADGAVAEYREAIRLKPDVAEAHYNLGNVLLARQELDGAAAEHREAIRLKPDFAEAHNNLGNALQAKGDLKGARSSFHRAGELARPGSELARALPRTISQLDQYIALLARLPGVVKGEEKVRDPAEETAFAQVCYDRGMYAAAARLWADALAADPKLADDRRTQHAYNAACASALAGCGKGKDGPISDDATRDRLRTQALSWLRFELSAWKKVAKAAGPGAGPLVAKTLAHWKVDADLAGVRDASALEKLPEGERKEWRAVWAEVDALLKESSS